MYIPPAFNKEDTSKLFDFVEKNSFGILVSHQSGKWGASHLPVLVDRAGEPQGWIVSHMAKANPRWNSLAGQEVLMIFQGPHAYVSPSWYENLESVPTWNYAAVHVYGRFVPMTREGETKGILRNMVRFMKVLSPNLGIWIPFRKIILKNS